MKNYSLSQLEESYDLEFDKILKEIKEKRAKSVLLQFPDGLKMYSTAVVDFLREKTAGKVEFIIWSGNCFGACDTPIGVDKNIDLIVQFGHNELMPSY